MYGYIYYIYERGGGDGEGGRVKGFVSFFFVKEKKKYYIRFWKR